MEILIPFNFRLDHWNNLKSLELKIQSKIWTFSNLLIRTKIVFVAHNFKQLGSNERWTPSIEFNESNPVFQWLCSSGWLCSSSALHGNGSAHWHHGFNELNTGSAVLMSPRHLRTRHWRQPSLASINPDVPNINNFGPKSCMLVTNRESTRTGDRLSDFRPKT